MSQRSRTDQEPRSPLRRLARNRRVLFWTALLILSLVWISLEGGLVPYLTFYTILLLPAASAAYLICAGRSLRFYQGPDSHLVTKSESIPFGIVLENTGPIPIVSLRLVLETQRCRLLRLDDSRVWSLNPGERLELSPEIVCLYAGAYPVGVRQYVLRDCFGLFSWTRQVPSPWRAIVRPQITDRAAPLLDMEHIRNSLELHSRRTGSTLGPDFREYRRGDPLRYIHWKNSARSGTLLVRLPEPPQMEQTRILMLPENMSDNLNDTIRRDHFLELAVSIADWFCRQDRPVVFYYPQTEMKQYIVDSYGSFQDFYEHIPDALSGASCGSMDWKTWLLSQEDLKEDQILLLSEAHVEDEPLIIYRS